MLQDDDTITNNRHREIEDLNSRNEFDVSEKKFGGQTEILSSQNRHQDSSRFNPFALSFIVRQWVYLNCISSKKKKKIIIKTNEYNINLNLSEDYILFVSLFINTSIIL